jgi:hypothetical protein
VDLSEDAPRILHGDDFILMEVGVEEEGIYEISTNSEGFPKTEGGNRMKEAASNSTEVLASEGESAFLPWRLIKASRPYLKKKWRGFKDYSGINLGMELWAQAKAKGYQGDDE